MKRTDPQPWPPTWKTPDGWVTDALNGAQSRVVMQACQWVKANKLTRKQRAAEDPALMQLRIAVESVHACFRTPDVPFPPTYVRVMGVDTGFANVGVMLVDFTTEFLRAVHWEHIVSTPDDGTEEERLQLLAGHFHRLFSQFRPDVVAYENVINVGHAKGAQNSASVRMLEVMGMIRMCCHMFACRPCYPVGTTTARKALFGTTPRGTKRSKQDVVARVGELLNLRKRLSEDVAEAGAVCFGGFNLHMEAERERAKAKAPDGSE